MAELTMVEALNKALHEAFGADERVVLLGEDVARTGGVFRVTAGLLKEYGGERVIDTPLSEAGIVGTAVGLSLYGMLPVVEIQFDGFVYPAFEQIVVHVARYGWRTNGECPANMVIRIPFGGGVRAPELHSDSPEALFAHSPGLKVVCPTTPSDARAMLLAAIAHPDPVIFMEPKRIYRAGRQEVSDAMPFDLGNTNGDASSLLSTARLAREGNDLVIFAYGATVPLSVEAAEKLETDKGTSVRVVDLRSLYPLDIDAITSHASACGRALVVHEAPRTAGIGAEVSSLIHERVMLDLEAPVGRVTGFDVPFPQFANEDDYLPSVERITRGAEKVLSF
ncbi:MAG TPA: alpha-ketoacid dehydrogenase subunit beta [Actinomycetota bacterium]|nr:alpha-ketoacid dehydrogenase subunit beta [Actinomycetota bacterium]